MILHITFGLFSNYFYLGTEVNFVRKPWTSSHWLWQLL